MQILIECQACGNERSVTRQQIVSGARTVTAVGAMIDKPDMTVTVTQLARHLKIDRSPVHRQVGRALDVGWLINDETRERRPARLRPGDPMPEDRPALPSPDELQAAMDARTPPVRDIEGTQAHCPDFAYPDAENGCAYPEGTPKAHRHTPVCLPAEEAHPQAAHCFAYPDAENGHGVPVCLEDDDRGGVRVSSDVDSSPDQTVCRCGSPLYESQPGGLCRTCSERTVA